VPFFDASANGQRAISSLSFGSTWPARRRRDGCVLRVPVPVLCVAGAPRRSGRKGTCRADWPRAENDARGCKGMETSAYEHRHLEAA
jgi:hypothetical protein